MGFRTLRVINQDRVMPGTGFVMHPHRDMEILSFVLEGSLKHKDSLGHKEIIRAGEVQKMSAGTGVMHSEFNPSNTDDVHFLQIWMLPEEKGLTPSYETKKFAPKAPNSMQLLASRGGQDGSTLLHQDISLYAGEVEAGKIVEYNLSEGRYAWIQVLTGVLEVNGQSLHSGDGAAVSDEKLLSVASTNETKSLLFNLN